MVGLVVLMASMPAAAATVLFPRPLHLVRRIEDPIAKSSVTVDEYCSGNRIVTVRGARVVVTDYDTQQVMEIDHEAHTWSVARFDEVAAAQHGAGATAATNAAAPAGEWKAAPLGVKASSSTRSMDAYALERPGEKIEVGVDREHRLSRQAVEALIGASYPNVHRDEHDALLRASNGLRPILRNSSLSTSGSAANAAAEEYALPVDQSITYELDGQTLTVKQSVLRIDSQTIPADALQIDAGAKRIESTVTRAARENDELDRAGLPDARSTKKP